MAPRRITFKYIPRVILNMPRKTRRSAADNPLIVGLSALVAVLLLTSASFNTPLISIVEPGGETASLDFSMIGLPLLALLVFAIFIIKVKK